MGNIYAAGTCTNCGESNNVKLLEDWAIASGLDSEAVADFIDRDPCEAFCEECWNQIKNDFLGIQPKDEPTIEQLAEMETLTDEQASKLFTLLMYNCSNHKSFSEKAFKRIEQLIKIGAATERTDVFNIKTI